MILLNVDTEQSITDGYIRNTLQYDLINDDDVIDKKLIASLWYGSDKNWYCTKRLYNIETINLNKQYNLPLDYNFHDGVSDFCFSIIVDLFIQFCVDWIDKESTDLNYLYKKIRRMYIDGKY